MAVCNIFNNLTKPTGTFLMFSQYTEDLAKWQTESIYHKIVPSKFIALDINPSSYNNTSLPRLFQVRYENACACYKNESEFVWLPEYSKRLFWNTMFESSLLSEDISEIKYVGDINIQSYDEVDGTGYSELYCYIPNDATAGTYSVSTTNDVQPPIALADKLAIEGFTVNDINGSAALSAAEKQISYHLDKSYNFNWNPTNPSTDPFNINTIIVLYDVWDEDGMKTSDIPMGIYFTGKIDNNQITNSITKYVSNPDIFDSGTSYSLRICSKFITGSQDAYVIPTITTESDNNGDLNRVLSQLSVSQSKMDQIVSKVSERDQKYRDLYQIFTNSKTNVPYIKSVNGLDYWFVNGKQIGLASAGQQTSNCEGYQEEELDEVLDTSGLDLSTGIQLGNTNSITLYSYGNKKLVIDRTTNETNTIHINWNATYGHQNLDLVSGFYIKDKDGREVSSTYDAKSYEITINPTESGSYEYEIAVEYNASTTKDKVAVHYVYPTYFGHSAKSLADSIDNIVADLRKSVIDSRKQSYIVPNSEQNNQLRHLYLIYPAEFGELTSIRDEQNHSYLSDFTKYDVTLHEQPYLLYIDEKGPVAVDNKIIYFQ